MSRLLLVDDDAAFQRIVANFLRKQGHDIHTRSSVKDALAALGESRFDLLLLDYRLPDGNGLSVLQHARTLDPTIPALMMTSFHDIRTAVKAIRTGAFDYITKPVNPDELLMILNEALGKNAVMQVDVPAARPTHVEGTSEVARQLAKSVQLVAPTEMSVVIQGESGTGKENVARSIHRLSKRAARQFVAVDCGALSSELSASHLFGHVRGAFTGADQAKMGAFEFANGGTLFLDEVGNLNYDIQVKLLRVLQEKCFQPVGSNETIHVDVRIICATNDELMASVKDKRFREDLYHRLAEFPIKTPALRDRPDDLENFIAHFIHEANTELDRHVARFSDEALRIFRSYDWPGNLRELRNVVRRSVLLSSGNVADLNALPDEMTVPRPAVTRQADSLNLKTIQETAERELIIKALRESKNNKSKAAEKLNIDRKTLYAKIARYNIGDE
jgi:two-component system, NtrC family, response regulator HydG